jgi:hypothetical protein
MHKEYITKLRHHLPGLDQAKARFFEEVGEVLQANGKCERFGYWNRFPSDADLNNIQNFILELNDLEDALIEFRKEILALDKG